MFFLIRHCSETRLLASCTNLLHRYVLKESWFAVLSVVRNKTLSSVMFSDRINFSIVPNFGHKLSSTVAADRASMLTAQK